jgi:hypothetical protein
MNSGTGVRAVPSVNDMLMFWISPPPP